MSYRKDCRSDAEFQRDITRGIEAERRIIWRWLDLIEQDTGTRPDCTFNGCGDADTLLSDAEVSTEADYFVDGIGKLEVKFSRPLNPVLHLKVSQLESYVKQNATILLVNGWGTDDPQFTLISPEVIKTGLKIWPRVQFKGFGNKLSCRIKPASLVWRKL